MLDSQGVFWAKKEQGAQLSSPVPSWPNKTVLHSIHASLSGLLHIWETLWLRISTRAFVPQLLFVLNAIPVAKTQFQSIRRANAIESSMLSQTNRGQKWRNDDPRMWSNLERRWVHVDVWWLEPTVYSSFLENLLSQNYFALAARCDYQICIAAIRVFRRVHLIHFCQVTRPLVDVSA